MPHSLGWYHTSTPTGFVLHLSATPDHLRATRALIGKTLADAGVGEGQSHAAQLVMSELFGNAVRPAATSCRSSPRWQWSRHAGTATVRNAGYGSGCMTRTGWRCRWLEAYGWTTPRRSRGVGCPLSTCLRRGGGLRKRRSGSRRAAGFPERGTWESNGLPRHRLPNLSY